MSDFLRELGYSVATYRLLARRKFFALVCLRHRAMESNGKRLRPF